MEYVGFWMRVIAYIIDSIILEVVLFVIAFLISMSSGEPVVMAMGGPLMSIIGLVLGLGYWSVMESSAKQATIGKMIIGAKVTDEAGNRISFMRALGRTVAKILSTIILLIGFIMVAFTGKKQGLHDKLAGTVVVHAG